ncbi:hypothetical protein ATCC90586_010546 [Pythium insidiosum]|nr:hypothetical protein ATCC90586_010546 [Pythium insidiosum]
MREPARHLECAQRALFQLVVAVVRPQRRVQPESVRHLLERLPPGVDRCVGPAIEQQQPRHVGLDVTNWHGQGGANQLADRIKPVDLKLADVDGNALVEEIRDPLSELLARQTQVGRPMPVARPKSAWMPVSTNRATEQASATKPARGLEAPEPWRQTAPPAQTLKHPRPGALLKLVPAEPLPTAPTERLLLEPA